jgi:hypothetical protein
MKPPITELNPGPAGNTIEMRKKAINYGAEIIVKTLLPLQITQN